MSLITCACAAEQAGEKKASSLRRRGGSLRYRYSAAKGLAKHPERFEWKPDLFTPTLDHLPGLPSTHKHFGYVTYPRFGPMGDDLFCSFRDGKAGLGDDHLYLYSSAAGRFRYVGAHLTGVRSNPYVHGMDWRDGRLHVTWVYRGFVAYDGWDDPLDTKHKRQAGPNGAENNHDICYAYSDDKGSSWRNGRGEVVASLEAGGTVRNDCEGIVAVEIPKGRGLTNQESQAVDPEGGVHVLNRDDLGGELLWKHYYRSPEGKSRGYDIPWPRCIRLAYVYNPFHARSMVTTAHRVRQARQARPAGHQPRRRSLRRASGSVDCGDAHCESDESEQLLGAGRSLGREGLVGGALGRRPEAGA